MNFVSLIIECVDLNSYIKENAYILGLKKKASKKEI